MGRFISPDPAFSPDLAAQIKPVAGGGSANNIDKDRFTEFLNNPQMQNRYSYALNNPLKYVDPDGRLPANALINGYNAVFTSGTGYRIYKGKGEYHPGVDMALFNSYLNVERTFVKDKEGKEVNVKILAAAEGTIYDVRKRTGYGNTVVLKHPGTELATVYAHLKELPIFEDEEGIIKEGQFIGDFGNSGNKSSGLHLHYEIRLVVPGKKDFLDWPIIEPGNDSIGFYNIGEYNSQDEIPTE